MNLVHFATERRVTIIMFVVAILVFGLVSAARLKLNLLPELAYPTLTIRTELPGAAPAEVENLVTKPIEEAVGVVQGVRSIRSVSRAGQSDVMLEFAWGTNMDYAGVDVREKLDIIELPREAERPVLLRFDPSTDPIMRLALAQGETQGSQSEAERLKYLRTFADEQMVKSLEGVPGVAAVKISGGLEEEIQVLLDQNRLAQLQLPIETVAARLQAENVNLSGGRLDEGSRQLLVRTLNEFGSIGEMADSVITVRQGQPVYLRDIAEVYSGHKEREAIIRVNGKEAVELAVYKEGDANTVSVADAVSGQLEKLRKDLPAGMELRVIQDQSIFISQAIDEVIGNALIGGLLAALVLFFFLRNAWITAIISVSIPVSVVATFNVMYGTGISLNIMSLGGIALAVGMLVDNAIVVLENIARHREAGKDPLTASRDGTSEVAGAITASTLTTVAVFFPMVFVSGIAGQLFQDQAIVVVTALLFSLLIALTVIPMLAAFAAPPARSRNLERIGEVPRAVPRNLFTRALYRLAAGLRWLWNGLMLAIMRLWVLIFRTVSWLTNHSFGRLADLFRRAYARLDRLYPRVLASALAHRGRTLLVALGCLLGAMALVPMLGMELIPQFSQGEFYADLRLPPGTALERTDRVAETGGRAAAGMSGVALTSSVAGTGNRLDASPAEAGENTGRLNVQLEPGADAAAEERVMQQLRDVLAGIPGLDYNFSRPSLFTFDTPLEVEISGYDLAALERISREVSAAMRDNPAFVDVKSSMEEGHPEVRIRFDHERASQLGLNVAELANRVVNKLRGTVATRYTLRDRKIDVLVRVAEQQRDSLEDIRGIIVNPQSERPVTLNMVADIELARGPAEIRRRAQQRVAVISANVPGGDLSAAAEQARGILAGIAMPDGLTARIAGQSEEMQASFTSMQFALLLAVFLVYVVMASQFESLLHPFVILFSVPLALTGAVLSLAITGTTISVVVFIGLIMLAGIVVNNAIVLIDLVNKLRAGGMARHAALLEAGRSRLRPIIMTTLTTVLGLLPMALGFGEGAEIRAPMAITVIGGLLFATLLTLVVIPVVYDLIDRATVLPETAADSDNARPAEDGSHA